MEIEQIDRDAAADWIERTATDTWGLPDDIRLGKCDRYPTVQAFAAHRLAAQPPITDADVERVARKLYETDCWNHPLGPIEPEWGRGGYKTQITYWQTLARAAIAALGE